MPLVDDLKNASGLDLIRRRFLGLLGVGGVALSATGALSTLVRFLRPSVVYEPPSRFPVGPIDQMPEQGVVVLRERRLYIVRQGSKAFALSAVCTHLGCMTHFDHGRQFLCPCHGSRFDLDGKVLHGPAPRGLRRVKLEIEQGQMVVDLGAEPGPEVQLEDG